MEVLVIVLFVAIAIGIGVLAWKAEQKRRAEMQALAAEFGLHYHPGDDTSHDDEYAQFEIFRRGHSRVAQNTLSGTIELFARHCRIVLGDFRYKVTRSNG